jgi:hypothetical protein
MLSRRSVTKRSGIVAAVIGVLALTSLSGATIASGSATARASAQASLSSPASISEGRTKCVPWPKPTSLGEKCTGTYSGDTAWNPWTWRSISQQPVVTVSQASDLTDQGVQINWSGFTPTLDNSTYTPNPNSVNPLYQVSIFECEGTKPDPSNGFSSSQCYTPEVGSSLTQQSGGPANGLLENTVDTSSPPKNYACPSSNPDAPPSSSVICGFTTSSSGTTIPYKSKWNGGNPATWTGQTDFHVEAPTPRSQGGFFKCGPSTPCSLVIVPNWGGTPAYNSQSGEFSWANQSLCNQHWIGNGLDPSPGDLPTGIKYNARTMIGNPHTSPYNQVSDGAPPGDLSQATSPSTNAFGQTQILTGSGAVASLQGASYACWAADRIVIPLSFAPTPNDCSSKTPAFYAQGSPMMQTQMLQWQAGWCNGPAPVTLDFTSNSESVARGDFFVGNEVGGASTDMALTTLPATAAEQQASHRQFTYAPLANSGAGIAYLIDDPNTGSQINRMVLDPRLLAKLITQSYTLQYTGGCTGKKPKATANPPGCDPAVLGNPYSLFDDPEFLSLNRQCQPYGRPASYTCSNSQYSSTNPSDDFPEDIDASGGTETGDFLPTVLAPDNDMTYDMTDWVAANSDAAKFLDGKAAPGGMHVNSDYLHVAYPSQTFPILDTGFTEAPSCSSSNPCTNSNPTQDVTMQASWNPQTDLDTIALDLLTDQPTDAQPLYDCPTSSGNCNSAGELESTSATSPQLLGNRDLLSELDLGDIAGYQFPVAELVNAAGKAVGPTQASVEAAVSDMKTNPDGITQYFDFASKDPAAYPLAMVDYAMVPTCGLSSGKASAIADFLTKVATTGQTQGEAPGDLAPGYYPLNANQKAQTLKAAQEVKAQTCASPSDHTDTSTNHTGTKQSPSSSPSPSRSADKSPAGGHQSPSSSPTGRAQTEAFGEKSADSGLAGLLLVLAIVVGVLLMLGGPTAWVITVTGRWPVVFRWVRAVRARLQRGLGRMSGRRIRRA